MAHLFTPGTGFFVRQPSWHRLEKAVLMDWPGTWDTARKEADLLWEPESVPIYEVTEHLTVGGNENGGYMEQGEPSKVPGYQRIIRSDNRLTLGIQSSAYRMVTNGEFGYVIESLLGTEFGAQLQYEGVFELDGGKMVVAMIRLMDRIMIDGDDSETFTYAVFMTRHDGRGGLRAILTNVRVVCANTANMAEAGAKEDETAFTIRHTGNWDERVAEVRDKLAEAMLANERYTVLCNALGAAKVTPAGIVKMTKRFLPIGDDMGVRQQNNREQERAALLGLMEGPTVPSEHRKTAYGWLQAATEWSDHYRPYRRVDTYVNRQLLTTQPLKVKAFSIAKTFAGVK